MAVKVQLKENETASLPANHAFRLPREGGYRVVCGGIAMCLRGGEANAAGSGNAIVEFREGDSFWVDDSLELNASIQYFCREASQIVFLGDALVDELCCAGERNWLDRVCRQLTEYCDWHQVSERFVSGCHALESDHVFSVEGERNHWVKVCPAEVELNTFFGGKLPTEEIALYLPAWVPLTFKTLSKSEIEIVKSQDVTPLRRSLGLIEMQRLWLENLIASRMHQFGQEKKRLEQREIHEIDQLAKAVQTLSSQHSPVTGSLGGSSLEPALGAIGSHLGVTFDASNTAGQLSVEQQIEVIMTNSRVRARRFKLAPNWRDQELETFLGFEADTGAPVAIINRRLPMSTQTPYQVVARSEATLDAIELLPFGYTFVVGLRDNSEWGFLKLMGRVLWNAKREMIWIALFALLAMSSSIFEPIASRVIVEEIIPDGDSSRLVGVAMILLVLLIVATCFTVIQYLFLLRFSVRAMWRVQTTIMDHALRLRANFFQAYSSGDMWNRIGIISRVGEQINSDALSSLLAGVVSVVFLVMCFYFAPTLAWISLLTSVAFFLTIFAQSFLSRHLIVSVQELNGKVAGVSDQLARASAKLRVAKAEPRAMRFWCTRYAEVVGKLRRLLFVEDIGDIVSPAIIQISHLAVFYCAARVIIGAPPEQTVLTVGVFFAFYSAHQQLVNSAANLATKSADIIGLLFLRKLIRPILESEPEDARGRSDVAALQGGISLKDVCFRYSPEDPDVLKDLNLEIEKSKFTAIVGASGAGKSSVLRLLLGFNTPQQGSVCYDGADMRNFNPVAVRKQIGTVFQSTHVPSGSIREIVSGNLPLEIGEVWDALDQVGLADEVDELPMGLNTILPEGGGTFSGGQRQRILIARALAAKPSVLFFDEATSALDNNSQQLVMDSLNSLSVTRLVIAHRLSTIKDADRIYLMAEGVALAAGTFDELLETSPEFCELAKRQMIL